MPYSGDNIASLLVGNAVLYGQERRREVSRYRISGLSILKLMRSNRKFLTETEVNALEKELAEFGWHLFQLSGHEYGLIDLSKTTSWTKLSEKRVSDLSDQQRSELLNLCQNQSRSTTIQGTEDED